MTHTSRVNATLGCGSVCPRESKGSQSQETTTLTYAEHCPASGTVLSTWQAITYWNLSATKSLTMLTSPARKQAHTDLPKVQEVAMAGMNIQLLLPEPMPSATLRLLCRWGNGAQRRLCSPKKLEEKGTLALSESQRVWLVARKSGPGSSEAQAS